MQHRTVRAVVLALLVSTAPAAQAADPTGVWLRPSTGTQIQMFRCGGSLCGRIVSVKDPARQPSVGRVILSGGQQSGDNVWEGDLFNTEDGSTYTGQLTLQAGGTLHLKGCVLASMVCKGETWTRVR